MKRFYKTVTTSGGEGGFSVLLDGKPVKTPLKLPLVAPTAKLAAAIAGEWRAQKDTIDPHAMPLTRLANTAIDRTRLHKGIAIAEIMNFARHDLLCYRAETPNALAKREARTWDPYLQWADKALRIPLQTTTGIATVEQDKDALARLQGMLEVLDPFRLTALHNATTLSGSAILALALWEGFKSPKAIWRAALVDEDYQKGRWGEDKDARAALDAKAALWFAAATFFAALE